VRIVKIKSKKTLIITAVVVLVIAAGIGVYAFTRTSTPKTAESLAQPGGDVSLSGPTDDEKTAGNTQKQVIEQREEAVKQSESHTGTKQVTPTITYVDQTGLNAFVPGIYEDGGTCTATVTMGSYSFTKTSSAQKDATTTSCSPVDFSSSDFPAKGDWQVVLTYKSNAASGSSGPTKFKVN
jgi:hypothetical protein